MSFPGMQPMDVYAVQIVMAEVSLGRALTRGQRIDLLLDNFDEIPGAAEAREIVNAIVEGELL